MLHMECACSRSLIASARNRPIYSKSPRAWRVLRLPGMNAKLYDVKLRSGSTLTLWAYTEDNALQIARTLNLNPLGAWPVVPVKP